MTRLKAGDAAPAFQLPDQQDKTVKLADFKGNKLLLYFYPKADTPGCTRQACSIRDARQELADLGLKVVGISPDLPARQKSSPPRFDLIKRPTRPPRHHEGSRVIVLAANFNGSRTPKSGKSR